MLNKIISWLEGTSTQKATSRTPQGAETVWPLDQELFRWKTVLGGKPIEIPFTTRDACEGVHATGAIGSGKTSGTGTVIPRMYMRAGYGGLVLCAKVDEAERWIAMAEQEGRLDDLVLFGPDGSEKFNFLNYEMNRKGRGAQQTENVVSVLMQAAEIAAKSKNQELDVWERAMQQMFRNGVDLLRLAGRPITLTELYQFGLENDSAKTCLTEAQARLPSMTEIDRGDFQVVESYWTKEWPNMADRIRSSVQLTCGAMVDPFMRGTIRDLLCTDTTITPEAAHDGKIIIVDLPIKEFHDAGRYAAVIWKYLFQRAAERRRVDDSSRPLFIFADEAHLFVTHTDADFQSTSRSSKTSTVYITQNLPNYYKLGGRSVEHAIDSLLGNMQTLVFHQNSCSVTNEWASKRISKTLQYRQSSNQGTQYNISSGAGGSSGHGYQEVIDYDLQPRQFLELAKGGSPYNNVVTAILFQGGKIFPTGKVYIPIAFQQS